MEPHELDNLARWALAEFKIEACQVMTVSNDSILFELCSYINNARHCIGSIRIYTDYLHMHAYQNYSKFPKRPEESIIYLSEPDCTPKNIYKRFKFLTHIGKPKIHKREPYNFKTLKELPNGYRTLPIESILHLHKRFCDGIGKGDK